MRTFIPMLSFSGRKKSEYSLPDIPFSRDSRAITDKEILGLKQKKSNGGRGSQKRLRQTLENWCDTIYIATRNFGLKNVRTLNEHGFLTLTLPAPQVHDDREIKRECLNDFLINYKRKFEGQNFIWKAENQQNGNIHFHLLIDKWADAKELRYMWQRSLNKLGYVDWYCYYGGNLNPNCTDIHQLRNIKEPAAYFIKYMVKDMVGSDQSGRIWGRNDQLGLLQKIQLTRDQGLEEWLKLPSQNICKTRYHYDYCTVSFLRNRPNFAALPKYHKEIVRDLVQKNLLTLGYTV